MANKRSIGEWVRQNIVTVIFIILCAACFILSGETPAYVAMELVNRLARNAFIVLSLIIPIVAGMGINFAITIGAMAAQIALLWVLEWQIPGIGGFVVAALMTIPIATLFGFLIGKLLNKMKGQEMIGGMILGYFANGLYQLLFLFIFGNLIPLHTDGLVIKGSTGVANTLDMSGPTGIRKALDNLLLLEFEPALYLFSALIAVTMLILYLRKSIPLRRLVTVVAVLAACIIADSVIRIIPGAIGDEASALTDCFQDNLLAPPVYTRPAEFNGWKVPDVLLSGNFARIDRWKEEQAWERTKRLRPDLLKEE